MPPGVSRPLRVAFSCPAQSHGYYAEIAAAPPDNVVCSWPESSSGRPGERWRMIKSLYRAAGLPFIQPITVPPGGADLWHACQHLPATRRPWVVDLEHGQPFVGTTFSSLHRRFTRRVILRMLAHESCRAILPWSPTAQRAFISRFLPPDVVRDKMRVVPPAVAPRGPQRRRSSGSFRVLFAANAPAHNFALKGGRELIEAFVALRQSHPDAELVLAGAVDPMWSERCAKVPGLTLTGVISRNELTQHYENADVFVMPSLSDTFGMAYLEAMASGLPVVALNRPYTRDIVAQGKTGILVPPGPLSVRWCSEDGVFGLDSPAFIQRVLRTPPDPDVVRELTVAMLALARNHELRTTLGTNARREIEEGRFSVATRNEQLGAIYRSAVRSAALV